MYEKLTASVVHMDGSCMHIGLYKLLKCLSQCQIDRMIDGAPRLDSVHRWYVQQSYVNR